VAAQEVLSLPDGTSVPVVRAFDNVTGCRPEERLLVVELPEAPEPLALRLEDGQVELGAVPEPGGRFEIGAVVAVRGLRLKWMKIGVKVSLRARVWSIGAR
jgi:hypothetical protein